MIRVISSFADGPVNFNPTGPVEDQTQKLISSTVYTRKSWLEVVRYCENWFHLLLLKWMDEN